jgi:type I restriction enzyme M protein
MSLTVEKELKQFNSLFFEFQYKHDLNKVFDDLLTMIICAMGRGTQENLYFETIKKYSKNELNMFCRLFGELMKIYYSNIEKRIWSDPLGTYYEFLAGNYKKSAFGQYFTPEPLCDMIAKLTIDPNEWGKNINEPACGSGRMILAVNAQTTGNYYICQDLDPICCKMTAINLCFHEVRAEVHCMNTLSNSDPLFSIAINYEYWKNNTQSILYYPKIK